MEDRDPDILFPIFHPPTQKIRNLQSSALFFCFEVFFFCLFVCDR